MKIKDLQVLMGALATSVTGFAVGALVVEIRRGSRAGHA
jgi:hypothetical protein